MQPDELVERLRSGEATAGAFLVSLCAPDLLGYARSVARDLSDADREVICELAIERGIRKIDRFDRSKGTFLGWLRGFVRNEAANWRRTHERLAALDHDIETPEQNDDHAATRPGRDEALAALAGLVAQLSPTDQIIIDLRERQCLPYSEIAIRTGASEDACRQRHLRARRRLRSRAETDNAVVAYLRGAPSSG